MKKNKYFDESKSLIENWYYLCMVVSIVFIVVQVVIARNSMEGSSKAELMRHTIEQCQYYRVSIAEKSDAFMNAGKEGEHGTLQRFLEVQLQAKNLGTMEWEEISALELIVYPNLMDENGTIDATDDVLTTRTALINELDQLAFIVLNGMMDERLVYENLGYPFLTSVNICAPMVFNPNFLVYNAIGNPQLAGVRELYGIWWLRDIIQKKEYIAGVYRTVLAGEAAPPYIEESEFRGLYGDGSYKFLTLNGESGNDAIRTEIVKLDREIKEHKKELDKRIRRTAIRNI